MDLAFSSFVPLSTSFDPLSATNLCTHHRSSFLCRVASRRRIFFQRSFASINVLFLFVHSASMSFHYYWVFPVSCWPYVKQFSLRIFWCPFEVFDTLLWKLLGWIRNGDFVYLKCTSDCRRLECLHFSIVSLLRI